MGLLEGMTIGITSFNERRKEARRLHAHVSASQKRRGKKRKKLVQRVGGRVKPYQKSRLRTKKTGEEGKGKWGEGGTFGRWGNKKKKEQPAGTRRGGKSPDDHAAIGGVDKKKKKFGGVKPNKTVCARKHLPLRGGRTAAGVAMGKPWYQIIFKKRTGGGAWGRKKKHGRTSSSRSGKNQCLSHG